MTTDDNSLIADGQPPSRILAAQIASAAGADENLLPSGTVDAAGPGSAAYLHAFRRRWIVATVVGVLLGGMSAAAVFLFYQPPYSTISSLHIAGSQQAILSSVAGHNLETSSSFEIYKNTQQQYLLSRFVLIAALRKPGLARFELFNGEPSPEDWLAKKLTIEFPGNAEIMNVALSGKNPQEIADVVNAVVEAYMSEVVAKEQGARQERLNELDRIHTDKETELRTKRGGGPRCPDQKAFFI